MAVRGLGFDLDQCLYDRSLGLGKHQRTQCYRFLQDRLGAEPSQCAALGALTLDGVRAALPGRSFTDEEFAQFVFGEYPRFIREEATAVRAMLDRIHCPKVLLSNNIRDHCLRVTQLLGLTGCFCEIISADELGGFEKPHQEAFIRAAQAAGCLPNECCMIDDSIANLRGAKETGMLTVWVVGDGNLQDDRQLGTAAVDVVIERVEQLVDAVPSLCASSANESISTNCKE